MILKSFEIENNIKKIDKFNFILIYGENIGLKETLKKNISDSNKKAEVINLYQEDINKNLYVSLSYIGTNYPNSKIDNYDELKFNLSFYDFGISYFKGLDNFPDYYEFSYSYNFFDNSLNFSFGDFDSYKNINSSNGSNYSIGIETLQNKFNLNFYYYYFNSNGTSDLDDDGFVFSISRKTSF